MSDNSASLPPSSLKNQQDKKGKRKALVEGASPSQVKKVEQIIEVFPFSNIVVLGTSHPFFTHSLLANSLGLVNGEFHLVSGRVSNGTFEQVTSYQPVDLPFSTDESAGKEDEALRAGIDNIAISDKIQELGVIIKLLVGELKNMSPQLNKSGVISVWLEKWLNVRSGTWKGHKVVHQVTASEAGKKKHKAQGDVDTFRLSFPSNATENKSAHTLELKIMEAGQTSNAAVAAAFAQGVTMTHYLSQLESQGRSSRIVTGLVTDDDGKIMRMRCATYVPVRDADEDTPMGHVVMPLPLPEIEKYNENGVPNWAFLFELIWTSIRTSTEEFLPLALVDPLFEAKRAMQTAQMRHQSHVQKMSKAKEDELKELKLSTAGFEEEVEHTQQRYHRILRKTLVIVKKDEVGVTFFNRAFGESFSTASAVVVKMYKEDSYRRIPDLALLMRLWSSFKENGEMDQPANVQVAKVQKQYLPKGPFPRASHNDTRLANLALSMKGGVSSAYLLDLDMYLLESEQATQWAKWAKYPNGYVTTGLETSRHMGATHGQRKYPFHDSYSILTSVEHALPHDDIVRRSAIKELISLADKHTMMGILKTHYDFAVAVELVAFALLDGAVARSTSGDDDSDFLGTGSPGGSPVKK